ncbi:WD40 repeat domain-containing protein [Flavilitoribacter nigricans]|nr:hypothetical protein [Flavilitoribacter nigricans]
MRSYISVICVIILNLVTVNPVLAQEGCYQERKEQGRQLMENGQYVSAVVQFSIALTCPDRQQNQEIITLIQETQKRQQAHYERLVQAAEKEAASARSARADEAEARALAEQKAEEARISGRQAEALRLSLLADINRQQRNFGDALFLAYAALQLSDSITFAAARKAFVEVVKDSFSQVVPTVGNIQHMHLSEGPLPYLSFLDEAGIKVYDLKSGRLEKVGPVHSELLTIGASTVVTARTDGGNEGQLVSLRNETDHTLTAHLERLTAAAVASDDSFFVTGARDHQAIIWNKDGSIKSRLVGHEGNIYQIHISPDGQMIVTRSSDGTARVWSVEGRQVAIIGQDEGYIRNIQVMKGTPVSIITNSDKGGVKIWEQGGALRAVLPLDNSGSIQVVLQGDRLITLTANGSMSAWDIQGNATTSFSYDEKLLGAVPYGDGQLLSWSEDQRIQLWQQNGTLAQVFVGHQDILSGLSGAPSAGLILSTGRDGSTKLWDSSGQLLTEWDLQTRRVMMGHIAQQTNQIVIADQGNQRLLIMPFPDIILEQLMNNHEQFLSVNQTLLATYNIQFWP